MAIEGFTLLWSKILRSSIWDETTPTRVVWITILALKDKNGMVVSTFDSLRRHANVSEEEARIAIAKFEAPDPASGTTEDDGRRLRKVPGGWVVINHEKYQYSSEERRAYWREQKAKQRGKESPPKLTRAQQKLKGDEDARERRFLAAQDRGASEEELDRIVEGTDIHEGPTPGLAANPPAEES